MAPEGSGESLAPASPPSSLSSSPALALAWLGLVANALLVLLLVPWWLWDPHLRVANLVVGLAAVLPVSVTGIVGSLAELRQRGWGRIVSIVALSLSLLLELSYGITRLALVSEGRLGLAIACGFSWILTLLLLLERCLRSSPRSTPRSSLPSSLPSPT
jgi:hypothetical protein